MKKPIIFAVVLVVLLCLAVVVVKRLREGSARPPVHQTPAPASMGATNVVQSPPTAAFPLTREGKRSASGVSGQHTPSRAERLKMSREERLSLLEKLGCVPADPDWSDYAIAEKASWWGKRLDPKSFWSNRVVWLDGMAIGEAWRHGRSYPPMPYDDPSVADLSDKDTTADGFDIQGGPNLHLVSTDREHVFWGNFAKTHPHPSDDIVRWQRDQARSWLHAKNILENDPAAAARLRMKPEELNRILAADRREAEGLGYPPECLTPDAYRWTHIMQKRQEYEEMKANGQEKVATIVSNFFRRVYVDRKYITELLSAEDIKAANAWKVAYLQRLRQEKTDESYINAYMQAWNLSSNDVLGVDSK